MLHIPSLFTQWIIKHIELHGTVSKFSEPNVHMNLPTSELNNSVQLQKKKKFLGQTIAYVLERKTHSRIQQNQNHRVFTESHTCSSDIVSKYDPCLYIRRTGLLGSMSRK